MATILEVPGQALKDFSEDDAMTLGAALAFYSALSFAPLLLLLSWLTSFLGTDVQQAVLGSIREVIGGEAASVVDRVLRNARRPGGAAAAALLGLVTLVLSATGVFAQLQVALNRIWGVKARPGGGVWAWIRKRVVSIGMVLTILFLLLVSLALSTLVHTLVRADSSALWRGVDFGVSLVVYMLLFAAMFKIMPDVHIEWRHVWVGAAVTAVLFAVGKWAIGLYLGNSDVGEQYGAAGSLIVLLVWVYYSSLILFLGAEFTQVVAQRLGEPIVPDDHAVWLPGARPHELPH